MSDCQQSGVFHCPQLMTTLEMTGSLPCLPELWNAASHSELDQVICASGRDCLVRGASIRVAVETLMAENWDGPEAFPVKPLTLPDLQVLVFCKQPSKFNYKHFPQASAGSQQSFPCRTPN